MMAALFLEVLSRSENLVNILRSVLGLTDHSGKTSFLNGRTSSKRFYTGIPIDNIHVLGTTLGFRKHPTDEKDPK